MSRSAGHVAFQGTECSTLIDDNRYSADGVDARVGKQLFVVEMIVVDHEHLPVAVGSLWCLNVVELEEIFGGCAVSGWTKWTGDTIPSDCGETVHDGGCNLLGIGSDGWAEEVLKYTGKNCADTAVVTVSGECNEAKSELNIRERFESSDGIRRIKSSLFIVDRLEWTIVALLHLCGSKINRRRPLKFFCWRRRECGNTKETTKNFWCGQGDKQVGPDGVDTGHVITVEILGAQMNGLAEYLAHGQLRQVSSDSRVREEEKKVVVVSF